MHSYPAGRHLYIIGGMSSATDEVLPFIERLDVVGRSLVRLSADLPVTLLGSSCVVLQATQCRTNNVAMRKSHCGSDQK